MRMARRRELRETYFGSPNSDNNVSRRGSILPVVEFDTSAAGDEGVDFMNAHNAATAGKKGPQTVRLSI